MLSPQKVIKQEGDSFTIKTVTAFRNYECSFTIGQEFTEVTSGMDNRSCQVKPAGNCCCVHGWKQTSTFSAPNIKARLFVIGQSVVTWDDNKLVCVQNGQKKNRGWTHWIEEDQLFLVRVSLTPGSWSLKVCHSCSVSPPQELTCENHVCRQVYKRKPWPLNWRLAAASLRFKSIVLKYSLNVQMTLHLKKSKGGFGFGDLTLRTFCLVVNTTMTEQWCQSDWC